MTVKAKIQENPVVTSISLLVLMAGGITAVGTVMNTYDESHTSAIELIASHPVSLAQIEKLEKQQVCSTLEIRIALVEEQIFQMELAGQNSSRLVEKKRLLKKMEKQYDDLHCASLN